MLGYTISYTAPRTAQPEIHFRVGPRTVTIRTGETVQIAARPEDAKVLPPGVTAELTAKPKPAPTNAAPLAFYETGFPPDPPPEATTARDRTTAKKIKKDEPLPPAEETI